MARLGEEGAICVGPLGTLQDLVPVDDDVVQDAGQLAQDTVPADDDVVQANGQVAGDTVPLSSQIQITNT